MIGNVYRLALGADTVLPGNHSNIYPCQRIGSCEMPPKQLTGDQAAAFAITELNAMVYWINLESGELLRCPSVGGCPNTAILANATALGGKALQPLIDGGRAVLATDAGKLVACDTDKCSTTVRTLSPAPHVIASLRHDATSIYRVEADRAPDMNPLSYRVMRLAN